MSDKIEFIPTGNSKKKSVGVGMPTNIYLHQYGQILSDAFDGAIAYHVGSSLTSTTWRDVDIRILLDPEIYSAMGFGDPKYPQQNAKWRAYTLAFSELGRKMTGLPIDFQIQERDTANEEYPDQTDGRNIRSALACQLEKGSNIELTSTVAGILKTMETIFKYAPEKI